MNERIKTLIKESGGHNIAYEGRPGSYGYAFTDNSVEKFAELIVKECALVAGIMEHEGRNGIGAQILDSFGVTNEPTL